MLEPTGFAVTAALDGYGIDRAIVSRPIRAAVQRAL